jgi:uncharacterized membrane protein
MPFSWLRTLFFLFLLALLITLVQLDIVIVAFEKLGLSRQAAYLLFVSGLLGSRINDVPLFRLTVSQPEREVPEETICATPGMQQMPPEGKTTVAVNLGGCVIPVSFSIYLLTHTSLAASDALIAVVTVALVAYLCSRPLRGIGVAMPLLVPPVAAAVVAVLLDYERRAPLAYVGGTLGVLLGADLFRLRDIRSLGVSVASIGGAGTFDCIFITGLVAVLLA